jgi:transposase
MKRGKTSTKCAGIDVGKHRLDVAVHGMDETLEVANQASAWGELVSWLKAREVVRVGMEATGGYERAVRAALEDAGFEVVVHQPMEVRLFARLKRLRAKNDRIDARVIAAATAEVEQVKAAADPRLRELAERLTAYELVADQIAGFKAGLEHVALKDLSERLRRALRDLESLKKALAATVLEGIAAHPDLAERHRLLASLPGVGPIVAASLVVRMPELGALRRGQAASLLGVAPFDRDSGQFKGKRFITGGRARPRRMVYIAALAAKRCDPTFKALAKRLADHAKPPKVIVIAIARRLIEAANLVLARGQPWIPQAPA